MQFIPRSLREGRVPTLQFPHWRVMYCWTSHNAILVLVSEWKWYWRRGIPYLPSRNCCHHQATLSGGYQKLSPTKPKGKEKLLSLKSENVINSFNSFLFSLSFSLKRKNFYEVQLQELIEAYQEQDLRQCSRKGRESLPVSIVCNCCRIWDVDKTCLHFIASCHTVFLDFFSLNCYSRNLKKKITES